MKVTIAEKKYQYRGSMRSITEKLIADLEQARFEYMRLTTQYAEAHRVRPYSALDLDLMLLNTDLNMAMQSAKKILGVIEGTVS